MTFTIWIIIIRCLDMSQASLGSDCPRWVKACIGFYFEHFFEGQGCHTNLCPPVAVSRLVVQKLVYPGSQTDGVTTRLLKPSSAGSRSKICSFSPPVLASLILATHLDPAIDRRITQIVSDACKFTKCSSKGEPGGGRRGNRTDRWTYSDGGRWRIQVTRLFLSSPINSHGRTI